MKTRRILQILVVLILAVGAMHSVSATSWAESQYYPLWRLTSNEYWYYSYLSPGTAITVPRNWSWGPWRIGSSAETAIQNNTVTTIVLAGVGSSSRGTAALARKVAIEINADVGGIVTGWGDWSTLEQATEGYYIARIANQNMEWYENEASSKLVTLYNNGARPTRVIGHSKGAMDSANAFIRMAQWDRQAQYANTRFITFGMGVFVPAGLHTHRQYMGSEDDLGIDNTVNWNPMIWVSGRYHTMNSYYTWTYVAVSGRLFL